MTLERKKSGMIEQLTVLADEWKDEEVQFEIVDLSVLQGPAIKPSELVEKLNKSLNKPLRVRTKDKVVFTLGVTQTMLTCFMLGASPQFFYLWHTFKAVTLLPLRYFLYKATSSHYFLLDFCYYANLLVLLYLWVFPKNVALFHIIFAMSSGPLAWSIATFRNSLVFHSVDKMTSLFIHISPCLVTWCLRWVATPPGFVVCYGDCDDDWTVMSHIVYPLIAYSVWAVFYYHEVFVLKKGEKGTTLFSYLMSQKGIVFKLCSKAPQEKQPLAFIGVHLLFTLIVMTIGAITWFNYWIHTLYLFIFAMISAFNGSNFYFEVFAKRYENAVQQALAEANANKK